MKPIEQIRLMLSTLDASRKLGHASTLPALVAERVLRELVAEAPPGAAAWITPSAAGVLRSNVGEPEGVLGAIVVRAELQQSESHSVPIYLDAVAPVDLPHCYDCGKPLTEHKVMCPPPSDAVAPVALERWGKSNDGKYLLQPMDDGYWTPWHIAQAALSAASPHAAVNPAASDAAASVNVFTRDGETRIETVDELAWRLYCAETAGGMDVRDFWHELPAATQAIYRDRAINLREHIA